MRTLVRVEFDDNDFFLLFDTEVNDADENAIKKAWEEIRTVHIDWGCIDCLEELIEVALPKIGLYADYLRVKREIRLV